MTQGNVKKPPVQGKKPSGTAPPVKQQTQQGKQQGKPPAKAPQQGKPPQQGKAPQQGKPQQAKPPQQGKPKMAASQQATTAMPPPASGLPKEQIAQRTYKQVIWADDNDVDIEDITFALPILISVLVLMVFLLRKYIRWNVSCPSDNRLDGRTCIVTGANTGIGKATVMALAKRGTTVILGCRDKPKGANTGIGKATATELAKRGATVILGCRDKPKGDAVALMIRAKTNNQDVYCYHLDLASLSDIKSFVETFNQRDTGLHVLVNNAAYMGPKATTVDHYERTFGVNFLGHFYLTYLLKEKLKRGAPCRIVNVISDVYSKGKLNFDDLSMADYDIYKAYTRSKLANVIFTHELHRRFAPDIIFSYGVHPGMVYTDLMRNWPGLTGNVMRVIARILFKTPDEGCQSVVFCAVSDKIRNQSGKFYTNCANMKVKASTKDKELGERLWNTALHLVGLDDEINKSAEEATKPVENVSASETKKDK